MRSRGRSRLGAVATSLGLVAILAVDAFAASGQLDPAFGNGGIATANGQGELWDVVVATDGRATVGGQHWTGRRTGGTSNGSQIFEWSLRRYTTSGAVDTSFGTNGHVGLFGTGDNHDNTIRDLAIDASNRVVAAGWTTPYPRCATVARFGLDGSLDTSFAGVGYVRLNVPGSLGGAGYAVALQTNGRLVVAGTALFKVKKADVTYPFVARLNSNGSLDTSFGTGGYAVDKRVNEIVTGVWGVGVQSTGRVVLAFRRASASWIVTRFQANGAVDTSFPSIWSNSDWLFGMAVDRLDRIVVSGKRVNAPGNEDVLVARYTSSGSPDTSFGVGGKAVASFQTFDFAWTYPVFQADDKIAVGVLLRETQGSSYLSAATVRLLDTGAVDTTWGSLGKSDSVALGTTQNVPRGVALAPDGGVILAGTYGISAPPPNLTWSEWFVARYSPN